MLGEEASKTRPKTEWGLPVSFARSVKTVANVDDPASGHQDAYYGPVTGAKKKKKAHPGTVSNPAGFQPPPRLEGATYAAEDNCPGDENNTA